MPKFALRYPFFIIMMCLIVMLVGVVNIASMPVDLFPKIDLPVVVVATFYNGMPPQQIEADITNTFERFFTLGANGGNSNTITIVDGMKEAIKNLVDIPESLKTAVVFDQSIFVKLAIKNLLKEASIGLVLTGLMILVFSGSPRATFAVLLSIPLSAMVCLLITKGLGGSINTMLLGGLALAFSRLIDDSMVLLENIFQLAQTRYQLGLSSIVELSQAQLQQTSAAIDNTNAQYEYRLSLATLNYQIGKTP
jgi:multidrug efflux pump subunit AcrB